LKNKIKNGNFTKVARDYGVTDNTVRKWCRKYNIPTSSKILRSTSDEGWEKEIWGDIPKKIKETQEKRVIAIFQNNLCKHFKTISSGIEFAKKHFNLPYDRKSVNTKHVADVCNGLRKTAYGFRWQLEEW
jgi:transposase